MLRHSQSDDWSKLHTFIKKPTTGIGCCPAKAVSKIAQIKMEGISRVKATKRGTLRMAPHDPKHLIALLDRAKKIEHEENRQLRSGCHEDCKEYEWTPHEATPEWQLDTSFGVIFTPYPRRSICSARHA